jgi:hypothetical protein
VKIVPIAVLALALGVSTLVATASSADPAPNTPGGSQVGAVTFGVPDQRQPTWHTSIAQSGSADGLYTYTVRRSYDDATVLATTGTGYVRANSQTGDAFLAETMTDTGRRIRIWDTSALPAALLLDETFDCTDSTPTMQVTPSLRYLAFVLQCTVAGSGGSDLERFTRVLDLGTPSGGDPVIHASTIGNIDGNLWDSWDRQSAMPRWSTDYDEVLFTWGLMDATRSRHATVVDLQNGTEHTWQTGELTAPSTGTTEAPVGFTPCGSSFVTEGQVIVNDATTGTTYQLRSTATGAVLGSYALPPADFYVDNVQIASDGTVDGRVVGEPAGTRATIGVDATPCDDVPMTPVPWWPAGSMIPHAYDFAGGRTLSWPALAGDDRGVTGYEVLAHLPNPHVVARVSGGATTSVVLPGDVPATEDAFWVFALDADGRRSEALNGSFYNLQGTPGQVTTTPTPTPTPTPTTTATPGPLAMPLSWVAKWPAKYGVAKVGKRVRVGSPTYSSAGLAQHPHAGYQWYIGGKAIKGATSMRLLVRKAFRHKKLTVRVTVSKPGYRPLTKVLSFRKVR